MSRTSSSFRRIGRIAVLTTAVSLALAGGFASTAFATGSNGPLNQPQPISNADANTGGANGQCTTNPKGPYCSTRDGSASMNGNNGGNATGRPAAGAVGKADNKNPKGQMPNAKNDGNNGYECDGNNGIAKGNPAHTACVAKTPTVVVPPKDCVPPAVCVPPKDCVPPKVCVPPTVVVPPKTDVPPTTVAPGSETPGSETPGAETPPAVVGVLGTSAETPPAEAAVLAAGASANPLPAAAAAGQADTGGQLAVGGFAAFAAFLALGAGFLLRRRHGEV